jgi:hypothetical protein
MSNSGGYAASHVRNYVKTNFLEGLERAGVPVEVLWAPVRYMSTYAKTYLRKH